MEEGTDGRTNLLPCVCAAGLISQQTGRRTRTPRTAGIALSISVDLTSFRTRDQDGRDCLDWRRR